MSETISYPCKIDHSMQPAIVWKASAAGRPLLVCLHTWSYDHSAGYGAYLKFCQENDWNMIFPKFRGPNWTYEACGSDYVVSDLEDAVAYMKSITSVDNGRIYLIGGSGGGHCSLLLAARRPDLWTAVSSWCPISDIGAWHKQCTAKGGAYLGYAKNIEAACGGDTEANPIAKREALLRSPVTWLANARGKELLIDIATGIHDGHAGSVPVCHALNAFNELAKPEDRISREDIDFITDKQQMPEHLLYNGEDPAFGGRKIYLRRVSNNARITIFEGGHDLLPYPAMTWCERQASGKDADWTAGKPENDYAKQQKTELTK